MEITVVGKDKTKNLQDDSEEEINDDEGSDVDIMNTTYADDIKLS